MKAVAKGQETVVLTKDQYDELTRSWNAVDGLHSMLSSSAEQQYADVGFVLRPDPG